MNDVTGDFSPGAAPLNLMDKGTRMQAGRASKALAEHEKDDVRKLVAALDPFHNIRQTMPMQYIRTFLLVALEEGLGVSEYARRAGVSQSVMSRHLLDIGDRNRHMEEGFGLITFRPNPTDFRKHEIFLTDKGRAIAHQLVRALRK